MSDKIMKNAVDVSHILDDWQKEKKRRMVAEEEWYKCRKYLIAALGMYFNGASKLKVQRFLGDKLKTIKPDPWTEKDLDFGVDPYGDED